MSDVVYLSIGTGIAAGIVLGGRLHARRRLRRRDRPHAGGPRRAVRLRRLRLPRGDRLGGGDRPPLHGPVGSPGGRARPRSWLAGDPDALAVWDEALDALAAALAWIASVLAPEAVVIGGGLSRAGAALFDPLNDRIPRHLTFQRVPRLVPAALGDRAGCIGAAPAGARFHPGRHVASGEWSRRP